MSLNYARELLKISISEICSSIGFDTTSQIGIDILVDVCERQFQYLSKQTSNLIQFNNNQQIDYLQFLFILLENNYENLYQLKDFMKQFQNIHFSNDIIQFPYKKRNQFYLRIPPKDSEQILQRELNETTEYIYDWLPLFPDQETPEQTSANNLDTNLDANVSNEQDKKFDKNDSHHPLTLLSFVSKNGDETNVVPVGKRPNRSLPIILYRPRRIIEIEVAAAAAEKAKKEQLEKENVEKDQQQTNQPPLRLTIPKPSTNNDKPSLIKKFPSNIDGMIPKKVPTLNTNSSSSSSSINLGKKTVISPTTINETHSQSNLSTNSSDILSNEPTPLDLTKSNTQTTTKVPTLKLNIKNVSNPQITNNPEIPINPTKKLPKSTINLKSSTNIPEKVNLKIRTASLPLFGTNETNSSLISPPIFLPTEPNINLSSDQQNKQILDTINSFPPISSIAKDEGKEKKKKKKHHSNDKDEKRIKIEEKEEKKISPIEQMDIDHPQSSINPSNSTQSNGGGAIRLKIKFGKPSLPPDELSSSINQPNINIELKPNPIRLTLPIANSSINRTPHRRKSGKIKHVPQVNDTNNPINLSFNEDNTNSYDDIPLGERTSPNKTILNNIQTNLSQQQQQQQQTFSTPIKKKLNSNKKKTNIKRQNNSVGVAVIEERRIHHDSQEKIWICPSCNRPDNGQEAMIACDLCDDWYHWECVGIIEEPPESIPWFCPKCHRSNSSTTSAQGIKPSASSKAKRQRASALYHQKQQQQQQQH